MMLITLRNGCSGVQRPLRPGPDVGYRLRGDTAGEGSLSALLQAQSGFGRLELSLERGAGAEVASAALSGGLVFVGDRFFATRPVEQSFAVVRVPGVRGVRAYLEHYEMGRTNADGDLLVPGLLPYYASRLSIADGDVPVAYRIGNKERIVALPPRGGAVVAFDVERLRAVAGWLRVTGRRGTRTPSYGTLEVDAPRGPLRSPVAEDGAFWLEDVPAGTHPARVLWLGEVCELSLSVPSGGDGVVEIGTVECDERDR
jgi:outer membrane usher protein